MFWNFTYIHCNFFTDFILLVTLYGLYHFLSSLDLESVIPIQIDIKCAVMTENVMTFLFSMFITYVMSFVTVWCFQGMIALRRGATELQHEDYMDAILEVQAKKKTNLQYYAWESDTSNVSYDVLCGLLALTDHPMTRCLIQKSSKFKSAPPND